MTDTAAMTDAEFDAALQAFVGLEVGPPQPAPDEVNVPMVRHWCEAIGDRNPVYLDAEAAEASVHGGLVAPPTMLQAWVMNGLAGPQRNPESPYEQMNQLLFSRGFTSVVATNSEQTYHRYVRPGDQLSMRTVIDSISPQKTTALGTGQANATDVYATSLEGQAIVQNAKGASWARPNWPIHANGELVSALDGNWAVVEKVVSDKLKGKAQAKAHAQAKAQAKAEKQRRKESSNPKDWGTMKQLKESFKLTHQVDPSVIWWTLGGFVLGIVVFLVIIVIVVAHR